MSPSRKFAQGFGETLENCGLHTIDTEGYPFTWERGLGTDAWIEEKLNRVIATDAWISCLPSATVVNIFSHSSDHSIIFIDVRGTHIMTNRGRKSFKFEMGWLLDEGYRGVVEEA